MAFYLSPLVDVNEIDLSTTIPAVATSIGVIVLRNTFKGPENKQILVTDETDLIRAFGEPTDTSYEDIMSATGFLKFGNKLYCTRVMPDNARFAGVKIDDAGTGANLVTGGTGFSLSYGDETGNIATFVSNTPATTLDADDGTYEVTVDGDALGTAVTFEITFDTGAITGATIIDGGQGFVGAENVVVGFADLPVSANATTGTSTFVVDTLSANASGVIDAGELTMVSGGIRYIAAQTYTVTGPAGEGAVITIDTVDAAGTVLTYSITSAGSGYTAGTLTLAVASGYDLSTGTLDDLASGDPDDFGDEVSVSAGDLIWTIASSRGDWADSTGGGVRIAFLDKPSQIDFLTGVSSPVANMPSEYFSAIDSQLEKANDFLVLVQAKDQRKNTWVTKEVFNVSTDPNALDDTGTTRFVERVVNQTSQYIRQAISVDLIGDEVDAGVQAHLATLSSDSWYALGDGSDGTGLADDGNIVAGYRLYENPEDIDINLVIDSGKSDTVKIDIISMCEERKDCMAVLDCPKADVLNNKGTEAIDLRTWRNSVLPSSSYAAVYGNWLEVYDKFNQKYRWIPATGYVAGIYAKTDDARDPWWAPAGLNRAIMTSVRRLAWNPKLGFRDILYSNGINPIVTFPGEGKVVWGQKTLLSKESAFNRINVRRLFLVLEKAIATSAKYFLFEPNDPATRNLLVNMITPFLRDVQSRRGIYDFKVVCDNSNNTPARVDRNELWCNIFIKPTRTAEFIVLNFVATATGASFEEAAAAV